jgi:ASC-1-like (ASCH) protein
VLNEENVMKKRVACPKLLVKCLVALGVVTALAVAVLWLSVGSVLPIGVGIVIAFWLLVGLGVLLYAMNLQIWLLWVEKDQLRCRLILGGYDGSFPPEAIHSVTVDYDGKYIHISIPIHSHCGLNLKLEYSEENLAFVRTFWSGYIDDLAHKALHEMKLQPSPFEKIKRGEKTIELRLYDEKRQQIKVGDRIVFTNTDSGKSLWVTVVKLHRFDSFAQLYEALPLLQCGYTVEDVDKAHPSDMEAYYSVEEQKKYGVVGIEIQVS